MELKPIRTKAEYKMALTEAEALWDAPRKSPEADWLEVLSLPRISRRSIDSAL